EVLAVRGDRRRPGPALLRLRGLLRLLREALAVRGLGGAGRRVAVPAALTRTRAAGTTGTTGAARATGTRGRRRGAPPVVVTAEGGTARPGAARLLRESGRGRRTGLLERLRAARTTGSARTARTAGTSLGLAAEGRARRDRLGRAVHLGGPGTLVLV